VQDDQLAGLDSLLRGAGAPPVRRIPVVTVRVAAVNGRAASALAADTTLKGDRRAFLAEHHVTYRDTLVSTERVAAGRWAGAARAADEVSLDRNLAAALRVAVGDTVTWNVQGVPLVTRVTSVRDVRWAPFEPDFSAVFAPRALAPAPKMHVVLADVADPAAAPRLQLRVAERFPNVGSLDLTFVRRTVREVTARASGAIRFLSLFCVAMAVPVLLGAVAATSRDRVREGVLLKTLGASRRQIGGIVLTEYALLGVLGALTGMLLSFGGAWAVLRFAFALPFTPVALPALAIAGAALALTTAVGVLGGREVFRRTPMEALRDG
jgi:putative ABC transport system permease protein